MRYDIIFIYHISIHIETSYAIASQRTVDDHTAQCTILYNSNHDRTIVRAMRWKRKEPVVNQK